MNPVSRGIRNAFRNGVRTGSLVLILGLSIGLGLTMLIAQKAVSNKIASVKSSIGNTVTIAPAGFSPGAQTNNALTTAQLSKVGSVAHVSSVQESLTDRLSTTGSATPSFGRFADSASTSTTSLTSPVTLGAGAGGRFFAGGTASDGTASFSLPVSFLGTNTPASLEGSTLTITSGKAISGITDTNDALISKTMAAKNNLSVGSTFTAYNTTLAVAGIFTSNTQGAANTVVLSLPALQRLSGQTGTVTSAVATVDSLDNLSSATSSIKSTLGTAADVTSAQDQANATVQPLNGITTVTRFSLIGALVAGGTIILLTMILVVRERKREIGVVKAIGGSNARIMAEFVVESFTLAVLGAIVGLLIGIVGGQPVTKALVSNSTSSTASGQSATRPGGFGGPDGAVAPTTQSARFGQGLRRNATVRGLNNIRAQIGWGILLDGFGAAVLIAALGSALSAGMIAKVRPATIMRTE